MWTQNYTTPEDDQKYGQKLFGRRKITRRLEKNQIKLKIINSVPSSFTKLAWITSIYIYKFNTIVCKSSHSVSFTCSSADLGSICKQRESY